MRMKVDLPEPDGPKMTTHLTALDAHADVANGAEVAEPLVDVLADDDVIALFERTGQDFRLVRGDVDGCLNSVGFRHG